MSSKAKTKQTPRRPAKKVKAAPKTRPKPRARSASSRMRVVPGIRVADLEELRIRLEEAESTLAAIRSGEVDALVVHGPQG